MTVTYTGTVGNASLSAFLSCLFRWRGSVWKAVWVELLAWCTCYATLSLCYRFAMDTQQQYYFEDICILCYKYSEMLPLTFLLGFYVTQVISRWQKMFRKLGWCDNVCLYVGAYFAVGDERSRIMKRSIARYISLLQILVYRDISVKIRKRFPTLETLLPAGVLTEPEKIELEAATGSRSKYYMPVMWAMQVVRTARDEGRIKSDFAVSDLYRNLLDLWEKQFTLVLYDWVPLPLVYTQVAFVTVRVYFLIALLGRQYIISDRYDDVRGPLDAYVPFFTMFQFLFYMGWLRVAEALLNPFGEDDDDFECNWIIDRNLTTSIKIVDQSEGGESDVHILKDAFYDAPSPVPMYSSLFVPEKAEEPVGSAVAGVKVPRETLMVPRIDCQGRRPSAWKESLASVAGSINFSRFRSAPPSTGLPAPTPSQSIEDLERTAEHTPRLKNRSIMSLDRAGISVGQHHFIEDIPEESETFDRQFTRDFMRSKSESESTAVRPPPPRHPSHGQLVSRRTPTVSESTQTNKEFDYEP